MVQETKGPEHQATLHMWGGGVSRVGFSRSEIMDKRVRQLKHNGAPSRPRECLFLLHQSKGYMAGQAADYPLSLSWLTGRSLYLGLGIFFAICCLQALPTSHTHREGPKMAAQTWAWANRVLDLPDGQYQPTSPHQVTMLMLTST